MLLYDKIDKKAYVFITSNHLPVNGWFQHCLVCDIITAQTQLFKINNDTYFYYYRCSPCKKKERSSCELGLPGERAGVGFFISVDAWHSITLQGSSPLGDRGNQGCGHAASPPVACGGGAW